MSNSNWNESSSFLATISHPEGNSLSTLVSDISLSKNHNSTTATIATVLAVTSRSSSGDVYNQTAVFEKNTRQQDQCWETYVGQVLLSDWITVYICGNAKNIYKHYDHLPVAKTSNDSDALCILTPFYQNHFFRIA